VRDRYQVVVIGGGIVGCSVLYHLTLRGLTDVALLEREELTAGSSWHAAGGFHAINADMRIAALQSYTIGLYAQIEEESGRSVGMHMSGGIELAGTPERMRLLRSELDWHRMRGTDAELLTPAEAAELVPIVDPTGLEGALWDPHEGNLDPNGATYAYAEAAKRRGAEVIQRTMVTALTRLPGGDWRIETEHGPVEAEHVVNAGGLWARRVAQMAGVDHPLTPMVHHFLVTDDVPEVAAIGGDMPAVTDLEGFTYLQKEGNGVLLGVYERNPRHWMPEGAPWDFGRELFPEEIDRIMPELSIGFARFPVLQEAGIRRWVNGAFTFTPDGNPLVGPVDGLPGYWAACGCMAGFSQCAAIGLAVANWIADGDPGDDVFGMDVARFGPWAADDTYLLPTTAQFYARRFVIAYPNEQLPAGRPLHTAPTSDEYSRLGAVWGVNHGLEVPLVFALDRPGFAEIPTLGRSNAFPIVAEEVEAVRGAAGAYEIAQYARYEVTGPGARVWLDGLLASALPDPGRIRLAPMLGETGRLMGDLSVTCLAEDRFWLTGSYYLQPWHLRWFNAHRPESGVTVANITPERMGFSVSGPASRSILAGLTDDDVSHDAFGFMHVRELKVGSAAAVVGRLSLTGELGYEIVVSREDHLSLWHELAEAGAAHGLRPIGDYAIDCLRLEKGYGIWNAEFTQEYTPAMSGLDRFIDWSKPAFTGRDAALAARERGPEQRLALLEVAAADADAANDEGVWIGERCVGFVTSGAFGHHVGQSLALAYLDREVLEDRPELTVQVIGDPRPARILGRPPYDPDGRRLRS
jgi:dimethylglycine dehydrogenase